jgi:hypothetical protein
MAKEREIIILDVDKGKLKGSQGAGSQAHGNLPLQED